MTGGDDGIFLVRGKNLGDPGFCPEGNLLPGLMKAGMQLAAINQVALFQAKLGVGDPVVPARRATEG